MPRALGGGLRPTYGGVVECRMVSRRALLLTAALTPGFFGAPAAARDRSAPATPLPGASPPDEDFWREIQGAYTLDRTHINLNNGGCSPSPRVVHEALKRYLDLSNQAPVRFMWNELEPGKETVRRELAREIGCDPEELAITRNASEALQIAQLGLTLAPGDEVIITDQDYPRMRDTWAQRAAREGVVVRTVSFPVPLLGPGPLLAALEAAITPRTKVIHVSHLVFLTGQVLPVKEVCAFARARGLVTIVDGAHAFAHVPADMGDIDCDYYGTSLHKWLGAPVGTGFLYVRKARIAAHWGLTPGAEALQADARKFEEIGTHPAANHDAIAEALVFHRGIGLARKLARLRQLRFRWSDPLRSDARFRFHTPVPEGLSGGIELVELQAMEPAAVVTALWDRWRIIATPIVHAAFKGIRVAPNVYTTLDEVDRFADALRILADG